MPRALSSSLRLAIKELKKESPDLKVPALITCLRHKKLIGADERINSSTLYRYLHSEELTKINEDATDKRHFEAAHPNDIWQTTETITVPTSHPTGQLFQSKSENDL